MCKKHILSPEKIRVIGFARDNHSDESFRDMVSAVIRERRENVDTQTLETFVRGFSYEVGAFEKDAGYEQLKRRIREKEVNHWGNVVLKLFIWPSLPDFIMRFSIK